MVSLMDFNPDKVVVLDWYEVVLDLFPDVDVRDRELCEEKLHFILKFIYFEPYHRREGNSSYWIRPKIHENAKDNPDFAVVKKQFTKYCENLLYLNWLLPSGIVLDDMENSGLISSFFYGKHLYASFADGCVVRVEPKLHEEFVPLYTKNDDVKEVTGDLTGSRKELEYLEVDYLQLSGLKSGGRS